MINGLTGCRKRNDLRLIMIYRYKDKIRQEQNHPNHMNQKNHSSDSGFFPISVTFDTNLLHRLYIESF